MKKSFSKCLSPVAHHHARLDNIFFPLFFFWLSHPSNWLVTTTDEISTRLNDIFRPTFRGTWWYNTKCIICANNDLLLLLLFTMNGLQCSGQLRRNKQGAAIKGEEENFHLLLIFPLENIFTADYDRTWGSRAWKKKTFFSDCVRSSTRAGRARQIERAWFKHKQGNGEEKKKKKQKFFSLDPREEEEEARRSKMDELKDSDRAVKKKKGNLHRVGSQREEEEMEKMTIGFDESLPSGGAEGCPGVGMRQKVRNKRDEQEGKSVRRGVAFHSITWSGASNRFRWLWNKTWFL